ncbi:MAG: tetratricopeptide repeat protein [Fibrobacteria bacterium]|nr:tetratricopeptide repeat protein [Fibrobacteria bacterium]
MTLRISSLATVLLFLWLAGCAADTRIRVRHVPEVPLPGVHSLKVEPFHTTGELHVDQVPKLGGLPEVLLKFAVKAGVNMWASSQEETWSQWSAADLRAALIRNGYFEIGDSMAADATLLGTCTYDVRDVSDGPSNSTGGEATVRIRFEVVDADGRILGSGVVEERPEAVAPGTGAGKKGVLIPDWTELLRSAMSEANLELVRRLTPHHATEKRVFAKPGSKRIRKANLMAARGDWNDAVALWREALEGDSLDRSSGWFNLAVHDEFQGDLDSALAKYEASQAAMSQEGIETSIERVRSRIREWERLRGPGSWREKKRPSPNPDSKVRPGPWLDHRRP